MKWYVKFKAQLLAFFPCLFRHTYPFYRASRTRSFARPHPSLADNGSADRASLHRASAWRDTTQRRTAAARRGVPTGERKRSLVRFSRSTAFFCGSRVSERTGRDLHADLRAGSNRLISNRFGPQRVSPPFLSPLLRPLPSSPIHVHFPFSSFLFFSIMPLSPSLSLSLSVSPIHFRRCFSRSLFSAVSFSLVGFLQSRHGRD